MPSPTSSTAPGPDGHHEPVGLLNINEIATTLRVSKMTVYRFIQDGRLSAIRVGTSWRVRRADLEAFMHHHRDSHEQPITEGIPVEAPHSPEPAIGHPATTDHARTTVVVGIDGSPASQQALRFAIQEARLRGGILRAVMIVNLTESHLGGWGPTTDPSALEQATRATLDAAVHTLGSAADGVEIERIVTYGDPARILIEEAHGAALLVVGAPRPGKLSDSVGYRCVQHATCPVTVVHTTGRTRGRQPTLSTAQQDTLRQMHATGDYSITDLAALFSVSRPTVYRSLRTVTSTATDTRTHSDPATT